jgi:hypothetical protein
MPTTINPSDQVITQYNIQTGGASNLLNNVAPSATSGVPVISQGSSSQPIFGTALIAGGGTGSTSFNINGAVYSNTTTTGALQAATLTNGQLLIGSTGAAPIAANLTAGGGITVTNAANSITIAATAAAVAYTNVNHAASPYTVLTTDYYLSIDASAGTVQLNFPNSPTAKQIWIVKDRTGSSSTNNITLTTPGGTVTFDGLTTYTINSNYQAVQLLANATPTYEIF